MPNTWDDDEEDLTVVEEKTTTPEALPETEDETVAFARKPSFFSKKSRRDASEEGNSHSSELSPFDKGRFPLHAALPRDRFAAFFVDSVLLTYILIALNTLLTQKLFVQSGFVSLSARFSFFPSLTYWSFAFLIVLLYYVGFEAVGEATPGKYLCRLRTVDLDGSTPTLSNVFLRNLCRLFDYPLFFAVAVLSMESSRFYQRLGDRAARTVVIKKTRKKVSVVDLRSITLASTFVRALGFLIDLIFFGAFIWFYLSAMNPKNETSYQVLLALFPVVALGYFMIFEMCISSTPGKIILKRQSILENGEPLDNSAAILRNLLRPLDAILAYPLLVISRRKQRLGDFIAETLVIKKESGREGVIALAVLLVLILGLAFIANKNPERKWFYNQMPSLTSWLDLKTIPNIQTLPKTNPISDSSSQTIAPTQNISKARTGAKPQSTSSSLKVTEFYLSAGPDPTQIRSDGLFHPGDLIFAFFKLAGFQKGSSGKVELVEDIQIEAPNGELLVDKSDVVRFSQTLGEGIQHVLFANQLLLPNSPPTGTYKMILIIRDLSSKTQLVYEKNFVIQ